MLEKKITIAGCGPGSTGFIPEATRQAAQGAEVLVGAERLLALFPDAGNKRIPVTAGITELLDQVQQIEADQITVLVSGCPGVHSLATCFVKRFGLENCHIIPAVSSVQVAFSRLGLPWAPARIFSAHKTIPDEEVAALPELESFAVLAGNPESYSWLDTVIKDLLPSHDIYSCENLTLEDELVRPVTRADYGSYQPASLAIVIFCKRI